MLTVMCMLAVVNLALACSKTNEFWWGNMVSGLYVTAFLAHEVTK